MPLAIIAIVALVDGLYPVGFEARVDGSGGELRSWVGYVLVKGVGAKTV